MSEDHDECSNLPDTLTLDLGDGTTIVFTPHPEHGWYNEEHNIILKWDFNWWSHSVVNLAPPVPLNPIGFPQPFDPSGWDNSWDHRIVGTILPYDDTRVDLPTIIDKENDDERCTQS